ncbi:MAG: hypothetical protein IJG81_10595 [Muribaculaceae bacterium]|nr:hypothetical protein [Muribaculaceae bacterium]
MYFSLFWGGTCFSFEFFNVALPHTIHYLCAHWFINNRLENGVNIVRTTYKNGKVTTSKVIR